MTTRRRRLTSDTESQQYVPLVINTGSAINYPKTEKVKQKNFVANSSAPLEGDTSMSRDRSIEFANAVQSLQSRNITRVVQMRDVKKVKTLQSYGEFMLLAKFVGSNISQTYDKLEKLTLLAKQTSLFNDKSTEIQQLSYIIKEDLKSLNEQLSRLQSISKDQNDSCRNSKHHLLSHSNGVVSSLQSKVVAMSNEFKQVLDKRTESMKEAKHRRDQFSSQERVPRSRQAALTPSSSSVVQSHSSPSLLLDEEHQYSFDDRGSSGGLLRRGQTQLIIEDETEQYLENRADTMQNIESTIVELGGIFQQLAHMVKEQDEMVERIDANVYDVEMNVEAAHHQILRYFQSVTSNRWLMLKIFAVLMFFFTFFVIFLT